MFTLLLFAAANSNKVEINFFTCFKEVYTHNTPPPQSLLLRQQSTSNRATSLENDSINLMGLLESGERKHCE